MTCKFIKCVHSNAAKRTTAFSNGGLFYVWLICIKCHITIYQQILAALSSVVGSDAPRVYQFEYTVVAWIRIHRTIFQQSKLNGISLFIPHLALFQWQTISTLHISIVFFNQAELIFALWICIIISSDACACAYYYACIFAHSHQITPVVINVEVESGVRICMIKLKL